MSDAGPAALAPVHFAEFAAAGQVNPALLAAYRREATAADVKRTHHFGGRFENVYIPRQRLPEMAPLLDFVLATARRLLPAEALRYGFWFNDMAPGHTTSLHSHEEDDELLSAVYYVDCLADAGDLVIHDDRARVVIAPRPGLLVLFPPDLPHEVRRNDSTRPRLSIGFNFGPANAP